MVMPFSPGPTVEDGVGVQDAVAPPYSVLRPLRPVEPGLFPVYADLADALLKPSNPFDSNLEHPDRTVAHTLATCSGYAYSDAQTLSTMMARMGLANNRCRMIGTYVDAMLITSTAFLVQSEDGKIVILAYRGTSPTNIITVLGDLDIHPDKVGFHIGGGGPYDVHAGFYRNVRATRFKVTEALLRAKRGYPVTASDDAGQGPGPLSPMEALYVTGHSLGGAMATLQSILLRTEESYAPHFADELRATYTFGQPMVGGSGLAEACADDEFLRDRLVRFIYGHDPAPHFPSRSTGDFRHIGREIRLSERHWRETSAAPAGQTMLLSGLVWSMIAYGARQFPLLSRLPFPYQLGDHLPQHYITALTPPGVPTEFGDYNYTGAG